MPANSNIKCSVEECSRMRYGHGMCHTHWARWRRHGSPHTVLLPKGNTPLQFWSKVEFTDSCWLWRGSINKQGYGGFRTKGRTVGAHRWAFEFCSWPIPKGLVIDHLCRVRNCVNPDHMEVVTAAENTLRGNSFGPALARKTLCVRGHPLSGDNLVPRYDGHRECATCKREYGRIRRQRRRQR